MKTALVLGAGGFIGNHLVKRLKSEGYWVRGVDLKYPKYSKSEADDFLRYDLRDHRNVEAVVRLEGYNGYPLKCQYQKHPFSEEMAFDEVYQLAADMGGAGYIFTGDNDANVMHNSATINLNVVNECAKNKVKKVFYSSSACMYPEHNQLDPENPNCEESSAYPANPDSEYGWEKLFSERLYLAYARNYGLDVRIARFHNIFGPEGTWIGGKEKAPAAICRKVADSLMDDEIEVWGDGEQTRSFLYIDECLDGIRKLMNSDFTGPVNIGSDQMISINNLTKLVIKIADKRAGIKNILGPQGVRGRTSDNTLIKEKLGWTPSQPLEVGLEKTYKWIQSQMFS
jgi:nucleoside-diphosphate-sugar epimerase